MSEDKTVNITLLLRDVKDLQKKSAHFDGQLRGRDDKPGLIARVASQENQMETLEESVMSMKSDLRKAVWIVLAGVIASILSGVLLQ